MENHEGSKPFYLRHRRWIVSALLVAIAITTILIYVGANHSSSSLPAAVRRQHIAFPVYYPTLSGSNFAIKNSGIVFDQTTGVLLVPVSNNLGHHITIAEQARPANLSAEQLIGQGTAITNVNGQAGVSSVEGRSVAFFVSPDNKTLVLLNSADASSDELGALVRLLRPAR